MLIGSFFLKLEVGIYFLGRILIFEWAFSILWVYLNGRQKLYTLSVCLFWRPFKVICRTWWSGCFIWPLGPLRDIIVLHCYAMLLMTLELVFVFIRMQGERGGRSEFCRPFGKWVRIWSILNQKNSIFYTFSDKSRPSGRSKGRLV